MKRHAPLVGLSALMTTTVPSMEKTIKLLREEAPWARIMVGGAVLTEEYATVHRSRLLLQRCNGFCQLCAKKVIGLEKINKKEKNLKKIMLQNTQKTGEDSSSFQTEGQIKFT